MTGNQMIRTGIFICAALVLIAVLVSVSGLFAGSLFGYANAENYTPGNGKITGAVNNLDIQWINGRVHLVYHGGSGIELRETSARPISDDMQMRWWLDGDTLRVRYAKNGFRLTVRQEKELTVALPEGIAFENVNIEATSGDLDIPALRADSLTLAVTSGNIQAVAEASKISSGAASGNINLEIGGRAEDVSVGTTSGRIRVKAEDVGVLKADSTSGSILITCGQVRYFKAGSTSGKITAEIQEGGQVDLGSTSGDIQITLARFSSMKAETTSGRVTAALPSEPGFTAKLDTVSGKIDYSIPVSRNGGRFVCGDGSGQVEIGTTSGNIRLRSPEE